MINTGILVISAAIVESYLPHRPGHTSWQLVGHVMGGTFWFLAAIEAVIEASFQTKDNLVLTQSKLNRVVFPQTIKKRSPCVPHTVPQ